jgi:hypothetical protein
MSKEEIVTVEANGRHISWQGKEYKPDKNDRLRIPRAAFNHIQAYGFFNPAVNEKVFRIGLKEVAV